jgi:hypothetical protein
MTRNHDHRVLPEKPGNEAPVPIGHPSALRSFAAVPQFPAGSCGRALVVIGISVCKAAEER